MSANSFIAGSFKHHLPCIVSVPDMKMVSYPKMLKIVIMHGFCDEVFMEMIERCSQSILLTQNPQTIQAPFRPSTSLSNPQKIDFFNCDEPGCQSKCRGHLSSYSRMTPCPPLICSHP